MNKMNPDCARIGHSRLKRALRHTLLLIGFVLGLGGMNAWGQREQGELMMSKTWTPTPGTDGHKGTITLETFVTGSEITTSTHQPNDIVLVLDFSRSMNSSMGTLKNAVSTFCEMMRQDAVNNNVDHRIAICSFAAGSTKIGNNNAAYDGTQLLTGTQSNTYPNYTTTEYQSALVSIKDGESLNDDVQDAIDDIVSGNCKQGTYMQYGLDMALEVFNNRETTTFTSEGKTYPRGMIVVFFTDGYPGYMWQNDNYWRNNQTQQVVEEADAAVAKAAEIKTIRVAKHDAENDEKPRIYSIGILSNASNTSAYITSKTSPSTSYDQWAGTGSGAASGAYACANGLLHFISSDYNETVTSWQGWTTTEGASAVSDYDGYYYGSSQMSSLQQAFANIASQSGATPINMSSATIIQDVISESFKLPAGATVNDIKIYAPKLTSINNVTNPTKDDYIFETLQEGILTLGKDAAGNIGVVTGGNENRLPTSYTYTNEENQPITVNVVSFSGADNKTLQITGFNFKENWCGKSNNTVRGRKIVIKIPAEIEDGVWGDGILTNGQMSVIYPNGVQDPIYFEQPIADVLGDVWTEIVTTEPEGFDPDNIDSPEDLAWFISEVNGRYGYDENNTIPSNPNLPGKLTADIDMSAHNWVPIGSGYKVQLNSETGETEIVYEGGKKVRLDYEGVFDGNGYVITGLKNNASKMYKKASGTESQVAVFPGMFANVKGNGVTSGVVKNVFVLDADFRAKHHDDGFVHFGIIADTLTGGAIYNCEAAGRLTCDNNISEVIVGEETYKYYPQDLILGGLVGFNDGGTIHSSMAMATLTGYCMGGAVGEMYNSTLANSFTNGVYNYLGESTTNPSGQDPQALFRYVGGLVGRNHHFKIDETSIKAGTINNCYVRFERISSFGSGETAALFGQLVGSNSNSFTWPPQGGTTLSANGTITNCYVPGNLETPATDLAVADDNEVSFPRYSITYDPTKITTSRGNDNMVGGTWTDGLIIGGTPLVMKLNQNRGSYAEWKRTTAGGYDNGTYTDPETHEETLNPIGGNINSDYPILKFTDYTCVASTDGITLDYAANLDQMLERHNNGVMNSATHLPGEGSGYTSGGSGNHNYHVSQAINKTQSDIIYGGAINLYANDNTSKGTSTTAGTVVYIDENVSLLQSTNAAIDAYTGQTMKSFSDACTFTIDPETGEVIWDNTNLNTPEGQRWHLVSSSLQDSKFGWTYGPNGDNSYANYAAPFSWNDPDPCHFWLEGNNNDQALFPTDAASPSPVDFYCFYEPQYHWINFKRNSSSHHHMDYYGEDIPANHASIAYTNETQFTKGKGYLMAIYPQYYPNFHMWDITTDNGNTAEMAAQLQEEKMKQFLQNRGTLNNGEFTIPVTYTNVNDVNGYNTGRTGYNLLGNPYQSYLDFDAFVDENATLLGNSNFANTYAVYDPETGKWLQYKATTSKEATTADRYINMHQGFFIQVNAGGNITFNNGMRTNTAGSGFRAAENHYPLINFTLTDSEGGNDVAVLEVGRPENDGAKKIFVSSSTGRLYLRHDSEDFAILFRDMTKGSQPLYFDAKENGTFTLSWNTANANFQSLTLVDNIAGVKYDMLTHDSYTFEGNTDNYKSRFKVVIGEFADVEENEEPAIESNFAFFDGSEWVVNGQGQLDVVDMLGRTMLSERLTSDQSRVSLEGMAQGVYLMRVTNGNEVKVQKIVVR